MKKLLYLAVIALQLCSCEKVIDLDLPTGPERLVIEGSLNWFNGTSGANQEIKLSLTAPFYTEVNPPALNAIVTVTDTNNTYAFTDANNDGIYTTNSFVPTLNETYNLSITYKGEVYKAKETMTSIVAIDGITQKDDGGFSGDEFEIRVLYNDPKGIENFYFFEFKMDTDKLPTLSVSDDEFIDGNETFEIFSREKKDEENEDGIVKGQTLNIINYGVSKNFYRYMSLLLQQTEDAGGGPFQTQPSTVKGNCINTTNPDNFPFGYFRASEAYKTDYIIK